MLGESDSIRGWQRETDDRIRFVLAADQDRTARDVDVHALVGVEFHV